MTLPAWTLTDEVEVMTVERAPDGSESLRLHARLRGCLQLARSRARRSGSGHASVIGGIQLELASFVLYLPVGTDLPAGCRYRVAGNVLWPVRLPATVGGSGGYVEVELGGGR